MKQIAVNTIMSSKQRSGLILRSKSQQEMVEAGGRLAQIVGMPRSIGQIFGLLYLSYEPISLSDISCKLSISKASTSTGTRQLLALRAIRKVWVPGERRDYFEAIDEFGELLRGGYKSIIKPRVNSSKNRLVELEQSLNEDFKNNVIEHNQYNFMLARLVKIKKFHHKIARILPVLEKILN